MAVVVRQAFKFDGYGGDLLLGPFASQLLRPDFRVYIFEGEGLPDTAVFPFAVVLSFSFTFSSRGASSGTAECGVDVRHYALLVSFGCGIGAGAGCSFATLNTESSVKADG